MCRASASLRRARARVQLTRLLEPYFGGNSKTLMFVNVSPNSRDMSETISVRTAQRAAAGSHSTF